MSNDPLSVLTRSVRQSGLIRFFERFADEYPSAHLKDLVVESVGPGREMVVGGRRVVNFGSDSFLGLDLDPRVKQAVRDGLDAWGTHNGSSRAFASVAANAAAERALAAWLGTEAALVFPSVTLANMGALPALVGRRDVLVLDERAHNSLHEGAKLAAAGGARVLSFRHGDPASLARALDAAAPYRCAVVALDGVYSMTGESPPLADLNAACLSRRAVLYVDDAHGTGVVGTRGRGTVLDALGSYDNALVVGSLSKAFSCAGGFVGCTAELRRLLQMRSTTYVFGGPVVPAYLEAVSVVCGILASGEYDLLVARLRDHLRRLRQGLTALGLSFQGGRVPIVSVFVGDEGDTLRAGAALFDRGHYVQSVTFPAVPYHAGVLRVQVNANHTPAQVAGLLAAMAEVRPLIAASGRRAA